MATPNVDAASEASAARPLDHNKSGNESTSEETYTYYPPDDLVNELARAETAVDLTSVEGVIVPQEWDEPDFCVVTLDGSCLDVPEGIVTLDVPECNDNSPKSSDSMSNLFDAEEAFQKRCTGSPEEEFCDATTLLHKSHSVMDQDLQSNESTTTLTNASSSTSNQYQPGGDQEPPNRGSIELLSAPQLPGRSPSTREQTLCRSDSGIAELSDREPGDLSKEELVGLVRTLSDRIIAQQRRSDESHDEGVTIEDIRRLYEIVEEQKHYIFAYMCDREQLQELVMQRDRESAEVVERLQDECLRLKRQNTIAVENKIRNGQQISRSMVDQLMKAKYDADKMLAECLSKQSKINELRLLILTQQRRIQDLETEKHSLRCLVERQTDNTVNSPTTAEMEKEMAIGIDLVGSGALSQVYNCDNMDQTPATGQTRCPDISTLNAFSVSGRRKRHTSSDSDRSSSSDVTTGSACSRTAGAEERDTREDREDIDAYLKECQLSIEKSMTDF